MDWSTGKMGRERKKKQRKRESVTKSEKNAIPTPWIQSPGLSVADAPNRALHGRCNTWSLEVVVLLDCLGGAGQPPNRQGRCAEREVSAAAQCLLSAFPWRSCSGFKEGVPRSAEVISSLLSRSARPAALLKSY